MAGQTRPVGAHVLAGLGGCVCALAWLDARFWPAAWVAVVVLVAGASHPRPGAAFRRAYLFGLFFHATGFHWLVDLVSRAGSLPLWAALLVFLLFCAYGALQFGIFAWLIAKWIPRGPLASIFVAAAWVAVEFLWLRIFPWGLGHSQCRLSKIMQIAEVTGVYGVSFLVLWGGTVCYQLVFTFGKGWRVPHRHGRVARWAGWSGIAWALVMTGAFGFGAWRTHDVERYLDARPRLRVGLIQPAAKGRERLRACRRRSREIQERVDLLVWPESTVGRYSLSRVGFHPGESVEDEPRHAIRPLPNPPCFLLCGGQSYEPGARERGPYYGAAFLVDREERIAGRYHKRTLVPFGEYIPGEKWFPSWHQLSPQRSFLVPGTSAEPLVVPGRARLGVLICYEDILAASARELVARGADLLVNLTNDDWFGESLALVQHQQLALFRAVETKRYLLRCTTTGSTAVISPLGRVIAQAPLHEPATLTVDVHTMGIQTFYVRYGDLFGYACVLFVAGTVVLGWRRRRGGAYNPRRVCDKA